MTDRLVVDASVAAKWFLRDEAQSEEAVQLLASALDQTLELHAPSLLAFELYRVVSRACVARQSPEGRPRITLREGVAAVDDFHGLPMFSIRRAESSRIGRLRSRSNIGRARPTFRTLRSPKLWIAKSVRRTRE